MQVLFFAGFSLRVFFFFGDSIKLHCATLLRIIYFLLFSNLVNLVPGVLQFLFLPRATKIDKS